MTEQLVRRARPVPRSTSDVLAAADAAVAAGRGLGATVWPTGFTPLDGYLGGGLRSGELTLLGGGQGLGKTTFALQAARNLAAAGQEVLYVCFEHSEVQLLQRLIALEAGLAHGLGAISLAQIRAAALTTTEGTADLAGKLGDRGGGRQAVATVAAYADRLHLLCTSGSRTGLAELTQWLADRPTAQRPAVFVDYLQKLRRADGTAEDDQITLVVEGLKDLALEQDVPVLAIVAADKDGLSAGRTRLRHLRGSTSLAYEADVALMLNVKYDVVAKQHLVYDLAAAERFRALVVCSVEKNRGGLAGIDLEFRTHFDQGRYDTVSALVAEQLVDERLFTE